MVGETRVLVTPDEPVVHSLIAGAFSLEAGEGHELPLFDEEVAPVLAREANFLELVAHELALRITNALGEGTLDVDGEALWTLDSCFHRCCNCWVVP